MDTQDDAAGREQPRRLTLRWLRAQRQWSRGELWEAVQAVPRHGIYPEGILERFEQGKQIPGLNQVLTLATVYGVEPLTIDLGPFDVIARTPEGHLYQMHVHRASEGPGYVARLEGHRLRNEHGDSPSNYLHHVRERANAFEFTGDTPEAAMAVLSVAVQLAADRSDEPEWATHD